MKPRIDGLLERVLGKDETEATIAGIQLVQEGVDAIPPLIQCMKSSKGAGYRRLIAIARDIAVAHGAAFASLFASVSNAADNEQYTVLLKEAGNEMVSYLQPLTKNPEPKVRA